MTLERGGELAPEPDEERFERELRVEIELLERPPGLPHGLGCAPRVLGPLGGGVRAQLLEPVRVDDGALRAGRDDDEAAIPRGELLERGEQLLALGPALGALQPLLQLALRQLLPLEGTLLVVPRLRAAGVGGGEQGGGRVSRLELGVEVRAARDGEQG